MKTYLKAKDHSFTKEDFELLWDEEYEMLRTSPKPKLLQKYYPPEDYISHSDAKRTLFEKLYQFIKKINNKRKINLVNSMVPKPKNLLDVGCGTGDFLHTAKNSGWDVKGVEPNTKARALAIGKDLVVNESLSGVKDEYYEAITLWHVLEHLPELNTDIERIHRLLSNTGVLVIAVPNFKSYDAQYYKSYWAGYDVPRHLWHFSQTSIKKKFEVHGFKLIKTKPMWFDAFYVSILSERYKNSTAAFLRGICLGLWSNLRAMWTKEYSSVIYVLKKA